MTNATDCTPETYAEKAYQWVAPAITKVTQPEPKVTTPDPSWQRYVGKYRNRWGDTQVLILKDALVAFEPKAADPTQNMIRLIPVKEHTFRAETEDGTAIVGELVTFEMDAQGKVKQVKLGENYAYPLAS